MAKTLSIIIPMFNEEKRLDKTLKTIQKGSNLYGLTLEQIIFVDDGSTDGTKEKINDFISKTKINGCKLELVSYPENKGRGYAIRQGIAKTYSDYVLYADADYSIPLSNLKKFVPYLNKNYDLLYGSKKKPGAIETTKNSLIRKIVSYGHSIIASFLLGVFAWDFQGGFKLFSRKFINEVFPLLTIDRWGFDMEVVFLAKKFNYKTIELPVVWDYVDLNSKVKLTKDIIQSIQDMILIKYYWLNNKYLSSPQLTFLEPALYG